MAALHSVWSIAALVFAINLPFGFWRGGVRKLTPPWFVAVHAPVVLSIGLRLAAGLPFRIVTLPLFVAAFFAGQTVGARVRRRTGGPAGGR